MRCPNRMSACRWGRRLGDWSAIAELEGRHAIYSQLTGRRRGQGTELAALRFKIAIAAGLKPVQRLKLNLSLPNTG